MRKLNYLLILLVGISVVACNGGSSSTSSNNNSSNQMQVIVDSGVNGSAFANRPFVTVTLCVPNTNTCQTIDHILLDSGSDGLRIPASVLQNSNLYPQLTSSVNQPLYDCINYAAGYDFGSLNSADVILSGEKATSVPFQIIDDSASQSGVPALCSQSGGYFNFIGSGQNGIIGIRNQIYDADLYFTCNGSTCDQVSNLPESTLIATPVIKLPTNNNGAILSFPNAPANGATSMTGVLTLGINTQANNTVNSNVNILYTNDSLFNTNYNNTNYQATFDSGTPLIEFSDPDIPLCTGTLTGLYCPASPIQLNSVFTSYNGGNQVNSSYTLVNPTTFLENQVPNNTLLPNTGAPCTGCESFADSIFLWGLPYFYGKNIYSIFPGTIVNDESAPALGFTAS